MPSNPDPYVDAKTLQVYHETPGHDFQNVDAEQIVSRILDSREQYEERQRVKGVKGVGEEAVKRREEMERDAERVKKERAAEAGTSSGART